MTGLRKVRIGNGRMDLDPVGDGHDLRTSYPAQTIHDWEAVLLPKVPLEKYQRVVIVGTLADGSPIQTSSVWAHDSEGLKFVVTENSVYNLGRRKEK